VSFVAWHRPLRERPRRYLLVSVGTIFRTDSKVLATLDAPQQAEEVGPSQLTHALVWTQPTQPAAGGGTPAGGATPASGGSPDAAGSSQAAMATPSPDQLGPQVVRAPDPLDVRPGPDPGWR
jgi:hypothetical protein